jgi:hypothetical protein
MVNFWVISFLEHRSVVNSRKQTRSLDLMVIDHFAKGVEDVRGLSLHKSFLIS